MLQSINPATGQLIKEVQPLDAHGVNQKIKVAQQAHLSWSAKKISYRQKMITNVASTLKMGTHAFAQIIRDEMGKSLEESIAEIEKCILLCEYYSEHASALLADEQMKTDHGKSYISYQPLGVILGVMPWNFPFWQVFRFVVPTLLAGNTCLLKHASNVPQCALLIETIFKNADFDDNCFINLPITSSQVADIIANPIVKAVSLTGSTKAGQSVAALAGQHLKPSLLELGGSDPYIVLSDANIDLAVEKCVASRLLNMGQSCISAKRFIIEAAVYDEFLEKFYAAFANRQENQSAPLATKAIRDELHQQVANSINQGASCLIGGQVPDKPGFYYPPTILTDLKPGMPAYDEELFGPVASVFKVVNSDEAIALANQSDFGLGGAIFSQDEQKAEVLARTMLQSGVVAVNDFVKSDPRLPFGGIKQSGYGRELAKNGLIAFTNIKTISINT